MIPSLYIQDLVFLGVSMLGLFIFVAALRKFKQAETSQCWSGTQGRVIESRLETHTSLDSDDIESRVYRAIVVYAYSVMGHNFTGNRVAFGVRSLSRYAASTVLERYPLDRQITVYYNPDKPGQAVLKRVCVNGMLQIVIGMLLILAGINFAFR